MKTNTGPYKGARDFYPEDKRQQSWLFDKWRKVVESYGYEEYDAPILEPTDLYLMKGSAEIVNEQTYTFKDRGDRSVTIRTEMTPTVSRMIAGRRQEIAYPARWYSIPNLWRYERMQRGRLREFWQLNVDVFGISSGAAELEMLQIADDLFQVFDAKRSSYVLKVNSRVLVNTMFEFICDLDEEQSTQMIRLTDRKNKMTKAEFRKEVDAVTKSMKKTDMILGLLEAKTVADLPKELQESPSVVELKSLLSSCKSQGIRNVEFDITLMRGFDYYTDIVFEAFDTNPENNRAILGGGRYDGLVAQFGVEPVPTVGFAVGDVVFMDFLTTHKLVKKMNPKTEVIVIIREEESVESAQKLATELR
jgi:histidyl-tRNA synthetase